MEPGGQQETQWSGSSFSFSLLSPSSRYTGSHLTPESDILSTSVVKVEKLPLNTNSNNEQHTNVYFIHITTSEKQITQHISRKEKKKNSAVTAQTRADSINRKDRETEHTNNSGSCSLSTADTNKQVIHISSGWNQQKTSKPEQAVDLPGQRFAVEC